MKRFLTLFFFLETSLALIAQSGARYSLDFRLGSSFLAEQSLFSDTLTNGGGVGVNFYPSFEVSFQRRVSRKAWVGLTFGTHLNNFYEYPDTLPGFMLSTSSQINEISEFSARFVNWEKTFSPTFTLGLNAKYFIKRGFFVAGSLGVGFWTPSDSYDLREIQNPALHSRIYNVFPEQWVVSPLENGSVYERVSAERGVDLKVLFYGQFDIGYKFLLGDAFSLDLILSSLVSHNFESQSFLFSTGNIVEQESVFSGFLDDPNYKYNNIQGQILVKSGSEHLLPIFRISASVGLAYRF
jgi:hypothetical protein